MEIDNGREFYVNFCKQRIEALLGKQSLIKYIRNNKGQPIGVVVAYRDKQNNEVCVGYSLCNTKMDKFNKYIGLEKAIRRAVSDKTHTDEWVEKLPTSAIQPVLDMLNRAEHYFK